MKMANYGVITRGELTENMTSVRLDMSKIIKEISTKLKHNDWYSSRNEDERDLKLLEIAISVLEIK